MSTSSLIAQTLHPDYPFDLTTLTPVTQVATGPVIVAARKSFPVTSLRDVIAYAKTNPRRLAFAAGGRAGSPAPPSGARVERKTPPGRRRPPPTGRRAPPGHAARRQPRRMLH